MEESKSASSVATNLPGHTDDDNDNINININDNNNAEKRKDKDNLLSKSDEDFTNDNSPREPSRKVYTKEEEDTGRNWPKVDKQEKDIKRKISHDATLSGESSLDPESIVDVFACPKRSKSDDGEDSKECFAKPELPSIASILKDPALDSRHQQALNALYVIYRKIVTTTTRLRQTLGSAILLPMSQSRDRRTELANRVVDYIECMTRIHKNAEVFQPKTDDEGETPRDRHLRFARGRKFRYAAGEVFVASGCASEMCKIMAEALLRLSLCCIEPCPESGKRTERRNDASRCGLVAMETLVGFTSQCDVARRAVLRHYHHYHRLTVQAVVSVVVSWARRHLDGSLVPFENTLLQGCLILLYDLTDDEGAVKEMRSYGALRVSRQLLRTDDHRIRTTALFLLSALLNKEERSAEANSLTDACVQTLVQDCAEKLPVSHRSRHLLWDVDGV